MREDSMRTGVNITHRCVAAAIFAFAASCVVAVGCTGGNALPEHKAIVGGNASQGREVIVSKGCGSCHVIPGIHDAKGLVGPPLMFFSRRTMIAGELPNSPENLVRWLKNPPSVEPGTAMPDLGLTDQQAQDVAAYLYTLR
jgi:cytochrome c